MSTFVQKLQDACVANRSLLCVGLDPDPERMAVADVFQFNRAIVDTPADLEKVKKIMNSQVQAR